MRHQKNKQIHHLKRGKQKLTTINLIKCLLIRGKIKTNVAKAKTVKSITEKLITKSRINSLKTRRDLLAYLPHELVIRLMNEIALKYKDRKGGYIRLIKLKPRKGDNASQVIIELI